MANLGKISRLNADLRNEVCIKLYNGETSATILPWLNVKKEVVKILEAYFDGELISAQNLSSWKQNEYSIWLAKRQRIEDTKALSLYASRLAENSKSLAAGGAAILSGKILEVLNQIEDLTNEDPDKITALANAIKIFQAGEIASAKLKNESIKLRQSEQRISLEKHKFERQTCELFIKFAKDEHAKAVALSSDAKSVKMGKLLNIMFGKNPNE